MNRNKIIVIVLFAAWIVFLYMMEGNAAIFQAFQEATKVRIGRIETGYYVSKGQVTVTSKVTVIDDLDLSGYSNCDVRGEWRENNKSVSFSQCTTDIEGSCELFYITRKPRGTKHSQNVKWSSTDIGIEIQELWCPGIATSFIPGEAVNFSWVVW